MRSLVRRDVYNPLPPYYAGCVAGFALVGWLFVRRGIGLGWRDVYRRGWRVLGWSNLPLLLSALAGLAYLYASGRSIQPLVRATEAAVMAAGDPHGPGSASGAVLDEHDEVDRWIVGPLLAAGEPVVYQEPVKIDVSSITRLGWR